MFDSSSLCRVFNQFNYRFERLPCIHLPQRSFIDPEEQKKIVTLLKSQNINITDMEDTGILYADVFIAAPKNEYDELYQKMKPGLSKINS
jgi:hypothetical protein